MDYTVHGILKARILEWVAFPFSRESSQPGIEPRSPALQADSLPAEPEGKPYVCVCVYIYICVCIYMCVCIHIYVCIYIYVCTYMSVCVYMYVYM